MRRNELDTNSQLVRNIITNPEFVRVQSGNDIILTNWAANPSFTGTTTFHGFIGGGQASWTSMAIATDNAHSGSQSFKLNNCTVAGQANLKAMTPSATALKLLKGSTVSWSFWVYSTVAGQISPYWEGSKVVDGTYTGGGGGSAINVSANTWTYVTGTNLITIDSYMAGAGGFGLAVGLGASVWFDDFCITTSDVAYPYFDGDTAASNGYTYAWTGAPYTSSSVRKALAYVNRTNLLSNPSFESSSTTNTLRTNLAANPSFEASSGTTVVRQNLLTNPSMEATSGTVNTRTNLATNPSFEATSGTSNVRTNLITNPSFEATNGLVNVRTNSFTNPSLNTASGTAVMRTNLCANPNLEAGISGFTAANEATVSQFASTSMTGANVGRITFTGTTIVDSGANFTGSFSISPSQTYAVSMDVLSSADRQIKFSAQGTGTVNQTSATINVKAGIRQRISWAFQTSSTAPSGVALYLLRNDLLTGTLDFDRVLIESGSNVLPYFDGASPLSNLITNSSFETNTTGFAVNAGNGGVVATSRPASGAYSGTSTARATWTTGTTDVSGYLEHSELSSGNKIIAGAVYTASAYIKTSFATSMYLRANWWNGSTSTGTSQGATIAVPANTWTRVPLVGATAPAGTTGVWLDWFFTSAIPTGATVDMDAVLVEEAVTLNPYTYTTDLSYAWTGTANSSSSTQAAPKISGMTLENGGAAYRDSNAQMTGTYSARVMPGSGDMYTTVSTTTAGEAWTFSVDYRTNGTLTGTPKIYISGGGTPVSINLPLSQPTTARFSVTLPATTAGLTYIVAAIFAATTGDFWVDNILIEKSPQNLPFFTGSDTASGDFTYAWAGTVDGSVSYQQAPWVIGAGWNDRWYGNTGGSGLVYQAKGGISGNYARKLWKTASTGSIADTGINPDKWIPVSGSTAYTLSAWVRSSVDQNFNLYIGYKDSAGTDIGSSAQNLTQPVSAGMWTRLYITSTSPSGAASALPVVTPYTSALPMPAGGTLDFDNVLFESTSAMLPYFDGSTPERINRLYGVSFGSLVPEGTVSNGYSWGGDTWQQLNTTANATFRAYSSKSYFPDGTKIDASVEVANPTGATVTFSMDLGDSGAINNISVAPGERKRIATFADTRSDTLAFLDINPATTLLVRNPFMEIRQGSSAAPYFDGASDADYTYAWSGAANASSSYQQAPTFADNINLWNDHEIFKKTPQLVFGASCARVLWKNNQTMLRQFPVTTISSSKTVTVSFYVRPSITMANVRAFTRTYDNTAGTGAYTDNAPTTYTNCPAGVITRVSQTFTTSATTQSIRPGINVEQFVQAGEYIDIDGLLVEEEGTVNTYFDGANPIQNLISNSSFETDTSGWGANTAAPSINSSPDVAWIGGKSMKAVTTQSSADCAVTFNATLAPNTQYTMSWYVYSNDARTNCYFDMAGTGINISSQGSTPVSAKQWTRVSGTFTTPSTVTGLVAFYLHHSGGPTTVGSTLYIDAPLLERGASASNYYAGLGDFTYSWVGTANASSSIQQAPGIAGGYGRNNVGSRVWSSSTYSLYGGKSIASRSLGGSVYNGVTLSVTGLTAGTPYTFSAWVYMPTSLYGNGPKCVVNGGGMATTEGNAFTRVGEWGRVSLTFTPADTTTTYLYVITGYNDSPAAGPVFYTDGWMIESSPTLLPYFDGTNFQKNLCANGGFEVDTAGWNPMSAVLTRDTSKAYSGSASMKVDTSAGGAYSGAVYYPAVTMYRTYTISARVWAPSGTSVNFACDNLSAAPQMISGNNAWQSISMTGWATTPGFPVYLRSIVANQAAFWVDEVLVEESDRVNLFYEGAGDYTYSWAGVANASASRQQAPAVAGVAINAPKGGAVHQSSQKPMFGGKTLRLIKNGDYSYLDLNLSGLSPNTTYTCSIYVQSPNATKVNWVDRGGSVGIYSPAAYTVGTTYSQVSRSFTTGASDTIRNLSFGVESGDVANGSEFFCDGLLIEQSPNINTYFDGTTAASGDYTYAWTGAANASSSTLKAPMATGTDEVASLAKVSQSSSTGVVGVGSKAIRITPTHPTSGDSFAELAPMTAGVTFSPNTTYTISGDRTILAPQTNIGGQTGYRVNIGGELTLNYSKPATNTAGTNRVVATFTTGSGTALAFIRVYNGSSFGGGDVWWDNVIVEEGTTDGSYFDGGTPTTSGASQRWVGVAHASMSQQIAPKLDNYGYEPNIFAQPLPDGASRVTNRSGTTHSFQILPSNMNIGTPYTLLFRARAYKGGTMRIYGTPSAPLIALTSSYAWYRVNVVPSDTRLYFSSVTAAGGGFDISHIMIVEGTYLGNFVDGTTSFAKWDGIDHGSTSVGYPPSTPIA